jgi:uncharacterized protein (DUF2237 family)
MEKKALNVLGGMLEPCSLDPLTGYFRDGCCNTDMNDSGSHTVCVRVSNDFLQFSLLAGNDLITPRPEYQFPGLKPGDKWCVCISRWEEARKAGFAAPIVLSSSHEAALRIVPLEILMEHALDLVEDD